MRSGLKMVLIDDLTNVLKNTYDNVSDLIFWETNYFITNLQKKKIFFTEGKLKMIYTCKTEN